MTNTDIIIELAKLDGWEPHQFKHPVFGTNIIWWYKDRDKEYEFRCNSITEVEERCPYLTSRDAIIPVIEKQQRKVQLKMFEYLSCEFGSNPDEDHLSQRLYWALTLTAKQLCIALLKATGKWKE